jgi:hypothetical protein
LYGGTIAAGSFFKPAFRFLPSHLADAPSVLILDPDPVLALQERGFARHGQFDTGNNFK